MSDLHCPARILWTGASEADGVTSEELIETARGERVAAVYGSASTLALAARLARQLGVPSAQVELGSPVTAGQALADGHRGEAILVVAGPAHWSALAELLGVGGVPVGAGSVLRVDVDGDGWRVAGPGPTTRRPGPPDA